MKPGEHSSRMSVVFYLAGRRDLETVEAILGELRRIQPHEWMPGMAEEALFLRQAIAVLARPVRGEA